MRIELKRLFGGSSAPAQSSSTNTTTNSQPWAPAQPYIKNGMELATKLYSQGPQQYTPWSQVANFDPLQVNAMNGIRNYATSQGTQNFMNTANQAVSNSINGTPNDVQRLSSSGLGNLAGTVANNNLYDANPATNQMAYGNTVNPFTQQNVGSALQRLSNNFVMNTLPGLRHQAIGDGSYGSSRNEMAEAQAAGQLSADMQNTSQQMYGDVFNTAQNNSMSALNQLSQNQLNQANMTNQLFNQGNTQYLNNMNIGLSNFNNALNAPLSMLQQLGQTGLQQYQQDQNVLNDSTNRWNFNQMSPWNNLAQFKNMVDKTSSYGGSGSSSSYTASPTQPVSLAGNIMGGLLSAGGLAGQFMGKTGTTQLTPSLGGTDPYQSMFPMSSFNFQSMPGIR